MILNLADGYLHAVWNQVAAVARPVEVDPYDELGPHGDCWANAWALTKSDPDRYVYTEGLATSERGRVGPGWVIRPRIDYPHAWVFDRHTQRGLECTTGWPEANAVYRGVPIAPADVERTLTVEMPEPLASVLEMLVTLRQLHGHNRAGP